MKKHLEGLVETYAGKVVLVNLVNAHKYEGRLEIAFREAVDDLNDSRIRFANLSEI